jgi:hypothetical protein
VYRQDVLVDVWLVSGVFLTEKEVRNNKFLLCYSARSTWLELRSGGSAVDTSLLFTEKSFSLFRHMRYSRE